MWKWCAGVSKAPAALGEPRVRLRRMALRADRVARQLELAGVRVVAVRAADALAVHLALPVRAVDEHLVELLAVGVVQAGLQQARQVVVQPRLARHGVAVSSPRREWQAAQTSTWPARRPP